MKEINFARSILFFGLLVFCISCASKQVDSSWGIPAYKKATTFKRRILKYEENFSASLKNWIIEAPTSSGSRVTIQDKKLVMDVDGGATVWFKKKLEGNICIEYTRKVVMANGKNDRLSDVNQFWMATDPKRENLFTRSGEFSEYDSLLLYYVGFGGNTNSTTRFRKYTGNGERVLYTDLTDKTHLLEPNKEYRIKIEVWEDVTKFYVNEVAYFSFQDPTPLREGYFGLRTVQSRQEVDNFKVYRLK